jgi:hypothetical protein
MQKTPTVIAGVFFPNSVLPLLADRLKPPDTAGSLLLLVALSLSAVPVTIRGTVLCHALALVAHRKTPFKTEPFVHNVGEVGQVGSAREDLPVRSPFVSFTHRYHTLGVKAR